MRAASKHLKVKPNGKPGAVKAQNKKCAKVTVRKVAPKTVTFTQTESLLRHHSGNFRQSVHCTPSGKVY